MKKIFLLVVFILLVSSGLIVTALPFIIQSQLEKQLPPLLGKSVSIDAVEVQILQGEVKVKGVNVENLLAIDELAVDLVLSELVAQNLVIQRLLMNGLKINLESDQGRVLLPELPESEPAGSGQTLQDSEPPPFKQIQIDDISLTDAELTITEQGTVAVITVDLLNFRDFLIVMQEVPDPEPMVVQLRGAINGSSLSYKGSLDVDPLGQLSVGGTVELDALGLEKLAPWLGSGIGGRVSLEDLDLDIRYAGALKVGLKGDVMLQSVAVVQQALEFRLSSLDWSGELGLTLDDEQMQINTDGQLDIGSSKFTTNEEISLKAGTSVEIEGFNWRGDSDILLDKSQQLAGLEIQAGIKVLGLAVTGESPYLTVSTIELGGLKVDSIDSFSADLLDIQGMQATLVRNEDGGLLLPLPETPDIESDVEVVVKAEAEAKLGVEEMQLSGTSERASERASEMAPLAVAVTQVRLGGDSSLTVTDLAHEPAAEIVLENISLDVTDFSTLSPFKFNFSLTQGEAASFESQGELTVNNGPAGDITFRLGDFDLPVIAPWITATRIQQGRLTLDTVLELQRDTLIANNEVVIDKLKIKRVADEDGGTGLPVSLALGLLKDKNDRIKLSVPVESRVDELTVGFQDIIRVALTGASKKAALTYATLALQPFGSLVLLKDVATAVTKTRLEPVSFTPGSAELTPRARQYTGKIIKLMTDRPELSLTLCGFATQQDTAGPEIANSGANVTGTDARLNDELADEKAIVETEIREAEVLTQEQLLALARQRRAGLRQVLIDGGIKGKQLYACDPNVSNDDSTPRVELTL